MATACQPLQTWIPSSIRARAKIVNRCLHMPPKTCPTSNSNVVEVFTHHLPELAEHYLVSDDDIFLGRPVEPTDFFRNGKPYVWRRGPVWGSEAFGARKGEPHRLYIKPPPGLKTPMSAAPSPHYWYARLKSVAVSLENQYPDWFAFVGTHTRGRYSSVIGSDFGNVWPVYLPSCMR